MTAGLPGAGIGGIFYLLMALLAPAWETVRARRRNGSARQWRLVFRHFLVAASILASMWLAAWAIGVILAWPAAVERNSGVQDVAAYSRVIGRNIALFTMSTMAVVLAAVEILRLSRRVLDRLGRRTRLPERRQPAALHTARADDAA
jgi:hypothetical protein